MVDIEKLKELLTKEASKTAWIDDPDFMVDDYAAGNMDDAYYGGDNDGSILLARRLLEEFFTGD